MQIDIAPETERLVREEISSGHFRSVDEMIKAAAETWRERNVDLRTISKDENVTPGEAQPRRPLSARIREIWADMPDDVRAMLPADGASQHDHYIYGVPKRDQ
jgi:Arc/MetJ-type ribon-helix-helix transcriptional regulator